MVNNSINIIKTKESLNSDGQHFHQYHQNKKPVNKVGTIIQQPSPFKLSFVLMILMELLTINV
jgi:hypothetical protein